MDENLQAAKDLVSASLARQCLGDEMTIMGNKVAAVKTGKFGR